jgi:hypothetical protein
MLRVMQGRFLLPKAKPKSEAHILPTVCFSKVPESVRRKVS